MRLWMVAFVGRASSARSRWAIRLSSRFSSATEMDLHTIGIPEGTLPIVKALGGKMEVVGNVLLTLVKIGVRTWFADCAGLYPRVIHAGRPNAFLICSTRASNSADACNTVIVDKVFLFFYRRCSWCDELRLRHVRADVKVFLALSESRGNPPLPLAHLIRV
jgi:hypothetical protein